MVLCWRKYGSSYSQVTCSKQAIDLASMERKLVNLVKMVASFSERLRFESMNYSDRSPHIFFERVCS